MKAYTDKEESRILLKLGFPAESADMYYSVYDTIHASTLYSPCKEEYFNSNNFVPCWSLAALLELMPKDIYVNDKHYVFEVDFYEGYYSVLYVNLYDSETLFQNIMKSFVEVLFLTICILKKNKYV